MTRAQKALIVTGGYIGAVLVAWAVVELYVSSTSTPDRQSAAGMYAFGDSMVFLGAFTLSASPATALGLYYLRSVPRFWLAASVAAVAIAVTAVVAMLSYLVPAPGTTTGTWLALAPLRILLAPMLGLGFILALALAPTRSSRRLLMAATAMELGSFIVVALVWWRSPR